VSAFGPAIAAVARHRGVTACLVVAEEDGIVVDGTAQIGVDTAAFAALTASLYRKASRAADSAGFGTVSFCDLRGFLSLTVRAFFMEEVLTPGMHVTYLNNTTSTVHLWVVLR
jgi:hypothetical protein